MFIIVIALRVLSALMIIFNLIILTKGESFTDLLLDHTFLGHPNETCLQFLPAFVEQLDSIGDLILYVSFELLY